MLVNDVKIFLVIKDFLKHFSVALHEFFVGEIHVNCNFLVLTLSSNRLHYRHSYS